MFRQNAHGPVQRGTGPALCGVPLENQAQSTAQPSLKEYGVVTYPFNGPPNGISSGSATNSSILLQSCEKSLFTSPERQSVTSPAASGYLSVKARKLNSGS